MKKISQKIIEQFCIHSKEELVRRLNSLHESARILRININTDQFMLAWGGAQKFTYRADVSRKTSEAHDKNKKILSAKWLKLIERDIKTLEAELKKLL